MKVFVETTSQKEKKNENTTPKEIGSHCVTRPTSFPNLGLNPRYAAYLRFWKKIREFTNINIYHKVSILGVVRKHFGDITGIFPQIGDSNASTPSLYRN